jgi:Tol biopolymer transport system component
MKRYQRKPVLLILIAIAAMASPDFRGAAQNKPAHPYASSQPIVEARLFGEGIISTADDELNAVFAPDGKSIYFCKNIQSARLGIIVVSHFANGKWGTPEVASFSGQYCDYDPFFSADGSKLFFISNRPAPGSSAKPNFDIWMVEKTQGGWSEPKNIGSPINTEGDEYYPSLSADGTIYFSANRQGSKGGFDLYRSKLVEGKYAEPENLGENVNSQFGEIDSYIAPDHSFIVFASYGRPDSLGGGDLYISYNKDGTWSAAKNLGPRINSSAREYCPIGSPDGRYFFFTSFRSLFDKPLEKRLNSQEFLKSLRGARNGLGDVYQIDISALEQKP